MNLMDMLNPDMIMTLVERVVVIIVFITTTTALTVVHVRWTFRQITR